MSWDNLFIEAASNPRAWWGKAQDLMYSANCLQKIYEKAISDETNLHIRKVALEQNPTPVPREIQIGLRQYSVILMLIGMAIEDALKGILIARNPSLIGKSANNDQTELKKIDNHKLWKLAKDCDIKIEYLEKGELEDLLLRLQAHLEWVGRYPVPKRTKGLEEISFETASGGTYPNASTPSADYSLGQTVFAELIQILENEPAFIADQTRN